MSSCPSRYIVWGHWQAAQLSVVAEMGPNITFLLSMKFIHNGPDSGPKRFWPRLGFLPQREGVPGQQAEGTRASSMAVNRPNTLSGAYSLAAAEVTMVVLLHCSWGVLVTTAAGPHLLFSCAVSCHEHLCCSCHEHGVALVASLTGPRWMYGTPDAG
jgi:hypothetical protein